MRTRCTLFLLLIAAGGCATMRDVRLTPGPDDPPPPAPVALFADLHALIAVYDRVEVRAGGLKVKGTLVELSAEGLVIQHKKKNVRLACQDIDQVDKMGDPVEDGATIGVLLAIVPALNSCDNLGCAAAGLATFGGIGALLDMLVGRGPYVVYVRNAIGCGPG
jgi:hypothetical protein